MKLFHIAVPKGLNISRIVAINILTALYVLNSNEETKFIENFF